MRGGLRSAPSRWPPRGTIGLRQFVVELEDMPQVAPDAERDVRADALEDRGKGLVLIQEEIA